MADAVSKPLFVEFYGLPGCGKSTVSHIVAQRLSNEGYSIAEPSYINDHQNPLRRRFIKLTEGVSWFFFHRKLYNNVKALVKQNGYCGFERFTQTVNVLKKISIYRSVHSDGIVFWDQGLIQAAISLSTNGIINARENVLKLFNFIPTDVVILGVYIDVSEEIALERMDMRITNDSRVEKLKDVKMKKLMLFKIREDILDARKAFMYFGKEYRSSSMDSLDKITNEVYHFVLELLNII